MSIEEDYLAFRELAWGLQDRLNLQEVVTDEDLIRVSAELDPILADIVDGRRVALVGVVSVPVFDINNNIVDSRNTDRVVIGESRGIYAEKITSSCTDDIVVDSYALGILLITGPPKPKNIKVDQGTTVPAAFGLLNAVRFSIPDAELAEIDSIMPDEDDPIVHIIDISILNDPIDFDTIQRVFEGWPEGTEIDEDGSILPDLVGAQDMEMAMYLAYLNSAFEFQEVDISLDTRSVITVDTAGDEHEIIRGEIYTLSKRRSIGFKFLTGINKLCFGFNGLIESDTAYIPLSAISDMALSQTLKQRVQE